MQYKTTKRLFRGIYQYKIVLVCPGAQWFRSGNMEQTLEYLKKLSVEPDKLDSAFHGWRGRYVKTQEDLDLAFKLQHALSTMDNIDIRVESPWISIYTNDKKHIDALKKIDETTVKYISEPPANNVLTSGTIIMPKMNYDYRVTLGKTTQENSAFISWAHANKKVKLTKSCEKDLAKLRSWGGTHFYITGDNNLLMAKMHLGSSIAKVETIVKA